MKKILLVSLTVSLFFTGNPLQAAWYQTAYKAVERLWTPPAAPKIANKTLAAALQEHRAVQKQTNYWFLPTRSCLAGAITASATFLLGKTLLSHHFEGTPALAASIVGLIGTAASWALLRRHSQIKKRQYNQRTLTYGIEIFDNPELVLERESLLAGYIKTLDRWIGECEQKYQSSLTSESAHTAPDEQQQRVYKLLRQTFLYNAEEQRRYASSDLIYKQRSPSWPEEIARIKQLSLHEIGIDEAAFEKAYSLLTRTIEPIETRSDKSIKNESDLNRCTRTLNNILKSEAEQGTH